VLSGPREGTSNWAFGADRPPLLHRNCVNACGGVQKEALTCKSHLGLISVLAGVHQSRTSRTIYPASRLMTFMHQTLIIKNTLKWLVSYVVLECRRLRLDDLGENNSIRVCIFATFFYGKTAF
jgi:hypothetical protein